MILPGHMHLLKLIVKCFDTLVIRWVWIGVGVLLGASIFLTLVQTIFLSTLSGECWCEGAYVWKKISSRSHFSLN